MFKKVVIVLQKLSFVARTLIVTSKVLKNSLQKVTVNRISETDYSELRRSFDKEHHSLTDFCKTWETMQTGRIVKSFSFNERWVTVYIIWRPLHTQIHFDVVARFTRSILNRFRFSGRSIDSGYGLVFLHYFLFGHFIGATLKGCFVRQ